MHTHEFTHKQNMGFDGNMLTVLTDIEDWLCAMGF